MIIYDALGRQIKTDHINFVDYVVGLKQKSGSNPWPVIEACVNFWIKHAPQKWQSFLLDIKEVKETRKDQKFGQSKDKSLRYTHDVPAEIMQYIRCLYTPEELPMNQDFFHEFGRRFQRFKIAEKV